MNIQPQNCFITPQFRASDLLDQQSNLGKIRAGTALSWQPTRHGDIADVQQVGSKVKQRASSLLTNLGRIVSVCVSVSDWHGHDGANGSMPAESW